MINWLKEKILEFRYRMIYNKLKKLPAEEQIKVGKEIHSLIVETLSENKGEFIGMTSILFECPFPGHVSHIVNYVKNKIQDKEDPAKYYSLDEIGNGSYVLSLAVNADERSAALLSDSMCTLALCQVNTVNISLLKIGVTLDKEEVEILNIIKEGMKRALIEVNDGNIDSTKNLEIHINV